METINVKIIHPTNNSDIDVGLPSDIMLGDVFSKLVEAYFLAEGQSYSGVLKPRLVDAEFFADSELTYKPLDNHRSVRANGIKDNDTIQTLTSTQAGGYIREIIELWNEFYPYLDQIGTMLGIAGAAFGFGAWVKSKFGKSHTPREFTQIITDKELWNVHELAITLNITDDEAKKLLLGFGYKWNRQYSLYCKTDKTVEIIEKIRKSR